MARRGTQSSAFHKFFLISAPLRLRASLVCQKILPLRRSGAEGDSIVCFSQILSYLRASAPPRESGFSENSPAEAQWRGGGLNRLLFTNSFLSPRLCASARVWFVRKFSRRGAVARRGTHSRAFHKFFLISAPPRLCASLVCQKILPLRRSGAARYGILCYLISIFSRFAFIHSWSVSTAIHSVLLSEQ